MIGQKGFTLVEALTGGIISTVLAGTMISMIHMVGSNLKESAANTRLERLQTVASEQIRSATRQAFGAKLSGTEPGTIQSLSSSAGGDAAAHTNLTEVWLITDEGIQHWAYQISGDYLMERRGGAWVKMTVGEDTVKLDGANSRFAVFPYRKGIVADLRYKIVENGSTYAYPPLPDSILCRGNP